MISLFFPPIMSRASLQALPSHTQMLIRRLIPQPTTSKTILAENLPFWRRWTTKICRAPPPLHHRPNALLRNQHPCPLLHERSQVRLAVDTTLIWVDFPYFPICWECHCGRFSPLQRFGFLYLALPTNSEISLKFWRDSPAVVLRLPPFFGFLLIRCFDSVCLAPPMERPSFFSPHSGTVSSASFWP